MAFEGVLASLHSGTGSPRQHAGRVRALLDLLVFRLGGSWGSIIMPGHRVHSMLRALLPACAACAAAPMMWVQQMMPASERLCSPFSRACSRDNSTTAAQSWKVLEPQCKNLLQHCCSKILRAMPHAEHASSHGRRA